MVRIRIKVIGVRVTGVTPLGTLACQTPPPTDSAELGGWVLFHREKG